MFFQHEISPVRILFLLLALLPGILACNRADAQTGPPPAVHSDSVIAGSVEAEESVPVAIPSPIAKAVQRYQTGNAWWAVLTAWGIVLPLLLLAGGYSAWAQKLAWRLGRRWYFSWCLYLLLILAAVYALNWPLSFYLGYIRAHAYGLSNQTFSRWFGDSLKEELVLYGAGVLFLWAPYRLLLRSPRRWWFYTGLAAVPFYCFGMLIMPVVVDPLFNRFTPIEDHAIEAKILSLAERAGIHGSRVFQVNKSEDTKTINAYVTGFLGSKRIVLWDNALNKLTEHELLFVMGHEMGHYALNHIPKGLAVAALLTLAALYCMNRSAGVLLARWHKRFGFDRLSDFASLPLLMACGQFFLLLLMPLGLAYSRHIEHEADRFGLELTHYNHSAATGFVRFQADELIVPWPGWFYMMVRASHPSEGERIQFYNTYRPWENGGSIKYEGHFSPEPTKPKAAVSD